MYQMLNKEIVYAWTEYPPKWSKFGTYVVTIYCSYRMDKKLEITLEQGSFRATAALNAAETELKN